MKKHILICFALLLSCKEKPTYNPFDNQFNIDESYFKKDKLDTIWDTCGYYSLVKKEKEYQIEYHYYLENFLAKGFFFNIDTIKLSTKYSLKKRDSINSLLINYQKLNKSLINFNYTFHKQINNKILIKNLSNNTIDTAEVFSNDANYINFYRAISYINKKNKWN
ncbi:hypothetical protein [Tenacibaculum aiptasiae]|uniref:hypothetical protein n=1 Tax=Tenacibaculum aiptasiae TaxID=426481 RepID=UPI003B5A018A